MSVDRTEVARIADLARLRLDEDETERLTEEMNRILEYADRLREVGGREGGPAVARQQFGISGARVDSADVPDPLASGIDGFAPRTAEGFFVVPPPRGVTADEAG